MLVAGIGFFNWVGVFVSALANSRSRRVRDGAAVALASLGWLDNKACCFRITVGEHSSSNSSTIGQHKAGEAFRSRVQRHALPVRPHNSRIVCFAFSAGNLSGTLYTTTWRLQRRRCVTSEDKMLISLAAFNSDAESGLWDVVSNGESGRSGVRRASSSATFCLTPDNSSWSCPSFAFIRCPRGLVVRRMSLTGT